MYKAWHNHNIHPQIIKYLIKKSQCILSGQLMNSLFPKYHDHVHVIMNNSVLVIKVLCYGVHYSDIYRYIY